MYLLGYFAAAFIGISLGLIGGGGSILTVPAMVYLFGVSPLLATSYSLFIVGVTSLAGSISNIRNRDINYKSVFFLGAASVATVLITRKFLIPIIPKNLVTIYGYTITESVFTMVLFGLLMLLASISMISNKKVIAVSNDCQDCFPFSKLLVYGIGIGLVTGLLGAGGGFLLIPALVFLVKLPMKNAIATSLFVIALNSLFGFVADLGHFKINWPFLLAVTGIAITGVMIGGLISKKIPSDKLKQGFGWFVLVMGVCIIITEIFI